ncbi:hypothetical protein AAF712_012692 [Marasmius tenuissimus]|uniref:Uncharacterized protein n=1 Tax=Marasmius tenuissimus TaxID=585030 RepID=A0ABR2ZGY5_9AGAR
MTADSYSIDPLDFVVFKDACIQLYDADMLPENSRDLIEAVEEYTDYYFLDACTFADHFIEKVSLPHSVHFGLLDDSWTDSFEHTQI